MRVTPLLFLFPATLVAAWPRPVDLDGYPTLQAAIDANPGRTIRLPDGDYEINAALRITHDHTCLFGPARIIQTNPGAPIILIQDARGVRLENLELTRAEGQQEARQDGVEADRVRELELNHLSVSENHSHCSIEVKTSSDVSIEECRIVNYKGGPLISDRTKDMALYGYAFREIDGTGIMVRGSESVTIRNNRVLEFRLPATKATRDKYDLGTLTFVPKVRGRLMPLSDFETHYTSNWHQGSGIAVREPKVEDTRKIVITGNIVDNAAQGMDLHCDYVIVADNLIDHALIGMKAMHGAKHVLITGNQFTHCDHWGVLLFPGLLSHLPRNAEPGKPEVAENVDGGTVVSNNIFSDFGFGSEYWNWPHPEKAIHWPNVIAILGGQLPENPPIRDVLVTGNVVYDSGRTGVKLDGKWQYPPPRYHYALYVEQKVQPVPVNVVAYGNLFDPGLNGRTNLKE